MGIFRKRRYSSQTDFDEVSLWKRLREDFSQSSELVERVAAWMGNSRGRLAVMGILLILVMVAFLLVTILVFGTPGGADKNFEPVGAVGLSHMGQFGLAVV